MKNVAVLGSGSWGTALAFHLSSAGHNVRLWGRNPELISEMMRFTVPTSSLRRYLRTAPAR
jgi:glycerol-3-phosphate dehydrogenase (NAD(P)+)